MPTLTPSTMRVLITADSVGGVWRYAMDVARELKLRGASAAIAGLGPEPSATQRNEAARAGVPLIWLGVGLDWMATGRDGVAAAAAALDDVAADWQPTILHLNSPPLAADLAFRGTLVVAAHSCISTWWRTMRGDSLPADWHWHREATAEGFIAADAIIAPSSAFADALAEVYGLLPHLNVVWNGSARVASAEKQPYVLGAGRWWDESKNLAILDLAVSTCRWPVRVAGPTRGPNGASSSTVNVELLGDLPHDEARRLMAEAGIFVSPARYEPFGLAVLEAASAGAALVLSNIPTFRELWRDCALFVEPQDPVGLAHAINRLGESEAERRRLGDLAARRSLLYSLDAQIEGLLSVYAATATRRSGQQRGAA